ncbi:MAG: hypothetical protein ACYS7Y_11625 [Planctomycetota bacterium]
MRKLLKSMHLTAMEEMSMLINHEALEKVKTASMGGESFAKVLDTLAATLQFTGAAESHLTFDYQHDSIKVKSGELIPYITIGLRQATVKDQTVAVEADKPRIAKDVQDDTDNQAG